MLFSLFLFCDLSLIRCARFVVVLCRCTLLFLWFCSVRACQFYALVLSLLWFVAVVCRFPFFSLFLFVKLVNSTCLFCRCCCLLPLLVVFVVFVLYNVVNSLCLFYCCLLLLFVVVAVVVVVVVL